MHYTQKPYRLPGREKVHLAADYGKWRTTICGRKTLTGRWEMLDTETEDILNDEGTCKICAAGYRRLEKLRRS